MDGWYRTAKTLEGAGEGYVLATVIRAVAPTSAKPGDKAVVTEAGVVHGWVGGSCAEPTVREEAKLALLDGACRVVRITPEADLASHREGLVVVPMTCYSGGELEIYLEPHRAKRELVVFGNSPVAQALVEIGVKMSYAVVVVDTTERPPLEGARVIGDLAAVSLRRPAEAAIVVATHGVFDEDALACAIGFRPAYLGVVASPKRFASLGGTMQRRGIAREDWGTVDGPAGIDIGATTPEEIAVSIIAAITARRAEVAIRTERKHQTRTEPDAREPSSQGSCCHD